MNIIEALKKTGMATKQDNYCYAKIIDVCGMSVFTWFYKHNNNQQNPVCISTIKEDDWISYNPTPEIRPKEVGELWKYGKHIYAIGSDSKGLYVVSLTVFCPGEDRATENMIHGVNGWTREKPPVEDERVEIKKVRFTIEEYEDQFADFPHVVGKGTKDLLGKSGKLIFIPNK